MSYPTTERQQGESDLGRIGLQDFLDLQRRDVAEIVKKQGRPKNVALVVDGTRRMLQLASEAGVYSYEQDPANEMRQLMEVSVSAGDILFDMGVEVIIGPLATMGNLKRPGFIPHGLKLLLDPLTEEDTLEVLERHHAALTFYGDLDHIRSQNEGGVIDKYVDFFNQRNPKNPQHRVLVGLGISADSDILSVARLYSTFTSESGMTPSVEDLRKTYFGFRVPPVDIFIRSNEVKESGCLHPLLESDETQLYFPTSPGALSINEKVLRMILYDYLYNRIKSGGTHTHGVLSEEERKFALEFYQANRDRVIGVGGQVGGDFWVDIPPIE